MCLLCEIGGREGGLTGGIGYGGGGGEGCAEERDKEGGSQWLNNKEATCSYTGAGGKGGREEGVREGGWGEEEGQGSLRLHGAAREERELRGVGLQ